MEQLEDCAWFTCFVPAPPASTNEIFGFGDFIGAIALLIVFFQIVDVRYKFRLAILPAYFLRTLLALIAFIGLGMLTMELWLQQGWPTLRSPLTPSAWEVIFALLFLGTFVWLTHSVFIRPPVFRKRNARLFAQALYRVIVKGDDTELAVVADELHRSSSNLISLCATPQERRKTADSPGAIAYDVLLMIANRKFCRHVVASAQSTAIRLCADISERKRYDVPIGPFCAAVTAEAIDNKDSILYHETQEFTSDLIGNIKPWTSAVYGDFRMIQAMGFESPLNMRIWSSERRWDIDKWTAYTRVLLAVLRGYADTDARGDGHSIRQAIEGLKWLTIRVADIDSATRFFDTDNYKRLRLAIDFVKDAIDVVDKARVPLRGELRPHEEYPQDAFQSLAQLAYDVLLDASRVKGSRDVTWGVQHNTTWAEIFRRLGEQGRTWNIVRARLVRLLYDDIIEMDKLSPNYVGIRVVGLVLNVVGVKMPQRQHALPCERAIQKFASRWAKRNYLKLRQEYPDVAEAMLIGSLDFDAETQQIRKTYASWLGKEGTRECLELDKPEKDEVKAPSGGNP